MDSNERILNCVIASLKNTMEEANDELHSLLLQGETERAKEMAARKDMAIGMLNRIERMQRFPKKISDWEEGLQSCALCRGSKRSSHLRPD